VLGIGAVVIVIAAALALVLSSTAAPNGAGRSTLPPSLASATPIEGQALPAFQSSVDDPAVGLPIPEVDGTSFDGSALAIKRDDRPKLLLFIAHWCPHCQREVPVVQAWLNAGKLPKDVELISVATAIDPNRPNYPPDAWLAREGWTPPVLVDAEGSIASLYGLTAFPYWVAVDSQGRVVERLTGELTPDQLDALAGAVAK
jgi:thiol-disulfide isomerase/thioredoxin